MKVASNHVTVLSSTDCRALRAVVKLFLAAHAAIVFVAPFIGLLPTPLSVTVEPWCSIGMGVVVALLTWSAIVDHAKAGGTGAAAYTLLVAYVGWTDHRPLVIVLYTTFSLLSLWLAGILFSTGREK